MTYDPLQEKERIYMLLSKINRGNRKVSQEFLFKKTVGLALEELQEFEQAFQDLISKVEHLHVYHEMIKGPLVGNVESMITDIRFLIEKQYTSEELDSMPSDVYDQVLQGQQQKVNMLKKIGQTYLSDHIK